LTKKSRKSKLQNLGARLDAYRHTVCSRQNVSRGKLESWHTYAAVAGSALAMASNVSANTIVSSGAITNVFASAAEGHHTAAFTLDGKAFSLRLSHGSMAGQQTGIAALGHPQSAAIFWHEAFSTPAAGHMYGTSSGVKRLLSGAVISAHAGSAGHGTGRNVWDPTLFASWSVAGDAGFNFAGGAGMRRVGTWQPGEVGFVGVELDSNGENYFGWLKLEYFQSEDGLPQSIELLAEAYNEMAGSLIMAGHISNDVPTGPPSGAPEPATAALGLLAAGAAGVLAWRRRRKTASK
jgi:LPXTG-motif cell wall-anchored protein